MGSHDDPVVADHARVALTRAALVDEDIEELAGLLNETESHVLRQAAARTVVQSFVEGAASREYLDELSTVEFDDISEDLHISSWGIHHALMGGYWDTAKAWTVRHEEAMERACEGEEPHFTLHCGQRKTEVRQATSRLAAMGLMEPADWRQALSKEAWTCYLDENVEHPTTVMSKTKATWDGEQWSFGAWDHPTSTTSCLSQVTTTDLVPPEPVTLPLTLEQVAWPNR